MTKRRAWGRAASRASSTSSNTRATLGYSRPMNSKWSVTTSFAARSLADVLSRQWTVRSQTQIMDNFTILTAKSNAEAVQQHCMLTKSMTRAYKVCVLCSV